MYMRGIRVDTKPNNAIRIGHNEYAVLRNLLGDLCITRENGHEEEGRHGSKNDNLSFDI